MTERVYEKDAYQQALDAVVVRAQEGAVVLDRTIFYARGGGQPGDSGVLNWDGGSAAIVDTVKGEGSDILHLLEASASLPAPGARVHVTLNWERRYRHMRMHSCMHLLCALVDAPVTGGNLNDQKGRLDFDLPESTVDKEALTARLNALIERGIETSLEWISDEALAANPSLVKTMSVQPPTGAGSVRLLRIPEVDLQPCGGTHVANTAEIGRVRVSKIEKKSRLNRRINGGFGEA